MNTADSPGASAPQTPPSGDPTATPTDPGQAAQAPAAPRDGGVRSEADLAAAIAAGFAPRQPMFERGTRISDAGAERAARRERIAFDEQPTVADYCAGFAERIASEARSDVEVNATALRLSRRGLLVDDRKRFVLSPHAFKTLVTRMGIGGAGYLSKCWPELRAINFNRWADRLAADEREARERSIADRAHDPKVKLSAPRRLVLRTRGNANAEAREVFGVVTPTYTSFDVDRIAQALAIAAPEDARGTVSYNGRRARFTVEFHTTREPSEFVAGEFFRAGVHVLTDDTGSGSVVLRAFVKQHLCNNMVMIDRSAKDVARLQHRGTVEELANRFRNSFDQALGKLDHFLVAWDYAKAEPVIERAQAATTAVIPTAAAEAVPGFLNGILDRDLVPVRGKPKDTVPALMQMWLADTSSDAGRCNRAAIVNAFTRYAHEVEDSIDRAEEIQNAASALLFGIGERDPDPLPYVPLAA